MNSVLCLLLCSLMWWLCSCMMCCMINRFNLLFLLCCVFSVVGVWNSWVCNVGVILGLLLVMLIFMLLEVVCRCILICLLLGVCCSVLLSRLVNICLIRFRLVWISGRLGGNVVCSCWLCVCVVSLNFCSMFCSSFGSVNIFYFNCILLCFSCVSLNSVCVSWLILVFCVSVMLR